MFYVDENLTSKILKTVWDIKMDSAKDEFD